MLSLSKGNLCVVIIHFVSFAFYLCLGTFTLNNFKLYMLSSVVVTGNRNKTRDFCMCYPE